MNIVNHLTYRHNRSLPPITAVYYEYITCANGIFVRAENHAFQAQIPVMLHQTGQQIMGLDKLLPKIRWSLPKPPFTLLDEMYADAKQRTDSKGNLIEQLYYIRWNLVEEKYELQIPSQHSGRAFTSSNLTETPAGYITIADFHSHGSLGAFFSEQDDNDEKRFRFYGVLGCLNTNKPEIALRIGVYGHWHHIHFATFFQESADSQLLHNFQNPTGVCHEDKV